MVTLEKQKTVTAVMVVSDTRHVTSMVSAYLSMQSHDLAIVNTKFRKRAYHLISFYSGNTKTQIDFVLVRNRDQGLVADAKIVPYETVATQHRPLICTTKIAPLSTRQIERCEPPRIKWWRLKENEAAVTSRIRLPTVTTVEETWRGATEARLDAARSELGTTKPGRRKFDRQSWVWTNEVKEKVREKKRLYHASSATRKSRNGACIRKPRNRPREQ
ncbi:unnamed protein product [Heligmosomoides polygyrus]|uniref:Endo/exonuclease/phosphatase domain-containing protein n=1 Tax=Heligmosomoides polygyrus TaxID=6339 RepID=A0A183FUK8_HELPZ|nr:unnamed protein product [Heligmosomoides polygyrus]